MAACDVRDTQPEGVAEALQAEKRASTVAHTVSRSEDAFRSTRHPVAARAARLKELRLSRQSRTATKPHRVVYADRVRIGLVSNDFVGVL